jgi:hypothetical protein
VPTGRVLCAVPAAPVHAQTAGTAPRAPDTARSRDAPQGSRMMARTRRQGGRQPGRHRPPGGRHPSPGNSDHDARAIGHGNSAGHSQLSRECQFAMYSRTSTEASGTIGSTPPSGSVPELLAGSQTDRSVLLMGGAANRVINPEEVVHERLREFFQKFSAGEPLCLFSRQPALSRNRDTFPPRNHPMYATSSMTYKCDLCR